MDRSVRSLSQKQLEHFSILYDVMHGKNRIILSDDEYLDKEAYFRLVSCIYNTAEFNQNAGSIIWVTEMSITDFLSHAEKIHYTKISNDRFAFAKSVLPHFNTIFQIVDGHLTEISSIMDNDEKQAIIKYQLARDLAEINAKMAEKNI